MFTLIRENTSENGTFGRIIRDNEAVCYTCELPWKDNQNKISCIPKGTYRVTKFLSPSKGNVFLLHDVPNRDMIEIHSGNTIHDILGCILVGSTLGEIDHLPAVLSSKPTLAKLLTSFPFEFELEITGVCG